MKIEKYEGGSVKSSFTKNVDGTVQINYRKKGVTAITQNKKRVVLKLFAYEKWP